MLRYNATGMYIYFGATKDNLFKDIYLNTNYTNTSILDHMPYNTLKKEYDMQSLMFLHQIHSVQGYHIDEPTLPTIQPFKCDGDFLLTRMPHVGLGIMTGDCLPIMYYDPIHNSIAIAHAGWKGTITAIATTVLEHMNRLFNTKTDQVHIFFGPSARCCCYEVSANFIEYLRPYAWMPDILIQREGKFFFDVPHFNRLLLQVQGVAAEAIDDSYNFCTICDHRFFSHRRQKEQAGRQMTVVGLKCL